MRWWFTLVVLLAACRTTTPPLPTPPSAWELPLVTVDGLPMVAVGEAALQLDTLATASTTTTGAPFDLLGTRVTPRKGSTNVLALDSLPRAQALVLDFPRNRVLGLDASREGWLRWLDARAPHGKLESLPRVGPMTVKADVGDRKNVFTQLSSTTRTSIFPSALFDPSLVASNRVPGLHLSLGETDVGPLTVDVSADLSAEGRLGMDVLRDVVLLIPNDPNQGVWLLQPRE